MTTFLIVALSGFVGMLLGASIGVRMGREQGRREEQIAHEVRKLRAHDGRRSQEMNFRIRIVPLVDIIPKEFFGDKHKTGE